MVSAMTNNQQQAATEHQKLRHSFENIVSFLLGATPKDIEPDSAASQAVDELEQLFASHRNQLVTEILEKLPKRSGLNTDFDIGYDRAIKHISADIKSKLSPEEEKK